MFGFRGELHLYKTLASYDATTDGEKRVGSLVWKSPACGGGFEFDLLLSRLRKLGDAV